MSYKTHGIVPAKWSNEGRGGPKEIGEGRPLTEENRDEPAPYPTLTAELAPQEPDRVRQVAVRASPFASEVGTVLCVMWPPELCGVQPAMQSIFSPASRRNLEDALARHPKLRIYLMHAGWPFLADTKAILQLYPQVYVDLASFAFNPGISRAEFYGYLQKLLRAGFGKRLMFGSGLSPEEPFLTAEQKDDIFHGNAARFLRLPPQ